MKDIQEVLRRKQAQYAQLAKQIEALQVAADKLREVAPLLSEVEQDDSLLLNDADEEPRSMGAKASAAAPASPAAAAKPAGRAPRWP